MPSTKIHARQRVRKPDVNATFGGSGAVNALLRADPVVAPSHDRSETAAGHAEASGVVAAGRAPRGSGGRPLPGSVRRSMERRSGADLSGVRVHTDRTAARVTDAMGAEAMTHGGNIFFGPGRYDPSSSEGRALLTHELTHATSHADGAVHLKKKKMHLDFVLMKRKKTKIKRMLAGKALRAMGKHDLADEVDGEDVDHYGHWWTEIGHRSTTGKFTAERSWGWWPSKKVDIGQTLKITEAVPGILNSTGGIHDPHEDDDAETAFHPVMEVDDALPYDKIKTDVLKQIDDFATGFKGSWNWRLGWGKNCHTFQERMKKAVKLHHQTSPHWLLDPNAAAQEQADAAAEAAAQAAEAKKSFFEPWSKMKDGGDFIAADRTTYAPDWNVVTPEYLHALTDGQKQEILAYIGCQAWTLQDSISMWYGDQVKGVFAS